MCNKSFLALRLAKQRRHGTVYIAVLGTALIVAVMAISSIHIARLEVKESVMLDNRARAQLAARSGVECVLAHLKATPSWRTAYTSGTANQLDSLLLPLGEDSFDFILIDDDGDLADEVGDSVTLRCRGRSGEVRHVVEVTLAPRGLGLSCLSASVHSDDEMQVKASLTTDQTASSNSDINITAGSVQGNAQAVGMVSGTVSGTRTNGMNPPLEMPDTNSVFEYYLANGTLITYGQLSSGKIDRAVLSANSNPYSSVPNAQGIYIIDCQGNKVVVTNSRIQATVVFINAGSGIEVEESIHWEPFANNFPALMVEGDLLLKWKSQQALSESINNRNFNPSHTPYQGTSDTVNDDTYAGIISGLIYATGNIQITEQSNLAGVLVAGGEALIEANTTMDYMSSYYQSGPPGFAAGNQLKIMPGSWRQAAY